jgi:hypothetical protein
MTGKRSTAQPIKAYNLWSKFAPGKKNQATFSDHTSVSSPQFSAIDSGEINRRKQKVQTSKNQVNKHEKLSFGVFAGLVGQGAPTDADKTVRIKKMYTKQADVKEEVVTTNTTCRPQVEKASHVKQEEVCVSQPFKAVSSQSFETFKNEPKTKRVIDDTPVECKDEVEMKRESVQQPQALVAVQDVREEKQAPIEEMVELKHERYPEPLESKQHPLYARTLKDFNPFEDLAKEQVKVANNQIKILKPLNSADLPNEARSKLQFFKDILLMQLEMSQKPEAYTNNLKHFETLFRLIFEILDLKLIKRE